MADYTPRTEYIARLVPFKSPPLLAFRSILDCWRISLVTFTISTVVVVGGSGMGFVVVGDGDADGREEGVGVGVDVEMV